MLKYILAINTGKGFYTHEDRKKFTVFKLIDVAAVIDGLITDIETWKAKVGGVEKTESDIKKEVKKSWDIGVAEEKKALQAQLDLLSKQTFDEWWLLQIGS